MRFIYFSMLLIFLDVAADAQFRQTPSRGRAAFDSTQSTLDVRSDSVIRPHRKYRQTLGYLENDVAFGVAIGTPGGINAVAEGYYHRIGLRLSGGGMPLIFENIDGFQADLCFVLDRSENSLIECSAVYFQSFLYRLDDALRTQTTSFGAGLSFNDQGFFLELDAGYSRSRDVQSGVTDSKPGPWFTGLQIGYLH